MDYMCIYMHIIHIVFFYVGFIYSDKEVQIFLIFFFFFLISVLTNTPKALFVQQLAYCFVTDHKCAFWIALNKCLYLAMINLNLHLN